MGRVVVKQAGIRALERHPGVIRALTQIADDIQAEAVRTSPVDSGRYAASWRVKNVSTGRTVAIRVYNYRHYAGFVEFGFRHHRSGKHIAGQRILGRAVLTARR